MARLAGELCQGFHTHPFHSPDYLRKTIIPQIEKGAAQTGRTREDVQIVAHAFVITNPTERELVRQQISFYASTPSYQPVLAAHGWEEVGDRLRELSRTGKWMEMPALISDEMVETYAAVAAPEDLAAALKERYRGIADRINLYLPFLPGERDEFWEPLSREMNG